jgi:two-component system sensor histidine kinase/response regulator
MSGTAAKLLLVDDTEASLVALAALLEGDGVQILQARSGPEALELLLVHEIALALIDVRMPGMSGFELAELMRGSGRTKRVPIMFVTAGSHDPQRIFKGYESGAVDFLFKPIEPHVLKGKVEVFLELYRQRSELSKALRLNELFVGILGHDLRNPLGTILTGTRLLEAPLPDEEKRNTLCQMAAAGQRMADMIEQMLDLTRVRLGHGLGFAHAAKQIDIGKLARRAAEELSVAHPRRELNVEIHGECTAWGDPDRLLQLLSNVIGNALQHGTPAAPISLSVEADPREIAVRVRNGGWIPPSALASLFDPFRERLRGESSSRGLGLGLFICRQIALAHGGTVNIESSEAAGTLLTARLPRGAPEPNAASGRGALASRRRDGSDAALEPQLPVPARRIEREARAPAGRVQWQGANRARVLVVEDNLDAAETLSILLGVLEHEAEAVANGAAALAAAATYQPDVMLVDIGLPDIDGYEVARRVRAHPLLREVVLVALTGHGRDEDRQRAYAAGFDHHLVKPVDTDTLSALLAMLPTRPGGARPPAC